MDIIRIEHLLARRSELVTTLIALWQGEEGDQGVNDAESALALEQDINMLDEEIFQEVAADSPELVAIIIDHLDRAALLN